MVRVIPPMLISVWPEIQLITPMQSNIENLSRDPSVTITERQMKNANNPRIASSPRKPISSPRIANTPSVCDPGT